jgi:hypothetical protein
MADRDAVLMRKLAAAHAVAAAGADKVTDQSLVKQ